MSTLNEKISRAEHHSSTFNKLLEEYRNFFKSSQGAFLGEKRTYTPREGTIDNPKLRGTVLVQTTVSEKLEYLRDEASKAFNNQMSVDATNASGQIKAELVVEGESFGTFSSLELLRLKSFLQNPTFVSMIETIPVRSDSEIWEPNQDPEYVGRAIVQSPLVTHTEKTTVKESYILDDPNLARLKDTSSYVPQVAIKTTTEDLGDATVQKFSGASTQAYKASVLKRRSELYSAVLVALKKCNELESVKSGLTYDRIHNFLFK
jgi:hypothetical protein